jgi:MoaD family protein
VAIVLRCFAAAREAAGRATDTFDAPTVGALLSLASARYGAEFAAVLGNSRVWVNGDEPALGTDTPLRDGDEVAVLPPVSGGFGP